MTFDIRAVLRAKEIPREVCAGGDIEVGHSLLGAVRHVEVQGGEPAEKYRGRRRKSPAPAAIRARPQAAGLQKPAVFNLARNFLRQRPRMKPIDPVASPRRRATSL